MRKFLYPLPFAALLLCVFLFNCSNEGFKELKPGEITKLGISDSLVKVMDSLEKAGVDIDAKVKCFVEESCYEISRSSCYIIDGEEKPDSTACISFTCGWNHETVKYGEEAILSFAFKSDNIAQGEGCSLKKISYGTKELVTENEYTISASTIPGLSYSKDAIIVAEAAVTCGDKTISHKCKSLTVKSVPMKFTCKWTPEKVSYGEKSTLSFTFDPASVDIAGKEGCVPKILPTPQTTLVPGEYPILASYIPGLSYSKNDTIIAKATATCGTTSYKLDTIPCSALRVDSIEGPKIKGKLSFKKYDYVSYNGKDTNYYFFSGKKIDSTYINNTIEIISGCNDGNIKVKIDSVSMLGTKSGSSVRVTAVVKCPLIPDELVLDGISAEVLPDYKIGKCELSGNSKETMRSIDTLTVGIEIDNSYGRCTKIEYTLNGTTYSSSSSFPLTNSVGDLNNIKARITCSTNNGNKIDSVACPKVNVARYIKWDGCKEANRDKRDQLTFKSGKTIVDFACETKKEDYYISCDTPQRTNFSIEIDGYKEGDKDSDIRPNGGDSGYNFPNLEPIKDGNLYRYPIPVTVNNKITGDLKCGIW